MKTIFFLILLQGTLDGSQEIRVTPALSTLEQCENIGQAAARGLADKLTRQGLKGGEVGFMCVASPAFPVGSNR